MLDLLHPENYGLCTRFKSDGESLFVMYDMIEAPKPDPEECLDSCTYWKAVKAIMGGVVGAVVAMVICCYLTAWYCSKTRRRERELAFVAVGADEVALGTIEEQPPPPLYEQESRK